ncbi:MAG: carbohydrate ABC transporter permease [Spirochaetaceae bacterium]|nr:MAG: carbohydrate ABC transporter permease [Spirochaetaceae bacterium]TVQ22385.1 MAG: carbohydrate ABC transporter permease [Spirochaetaceae bacterium]
MTRYQISRYTSTTILYAVLATVSVLVFAPLLWVIGTSLKTYPETIIRASSLFPEIPQWRNYVDIFDLAPFGRYFVNTLVVSVAVIAITLITSAMAAYAFSRLKWPGRETVFVLYLSMLIIPVHVVLVPNFILLRELRLLDTLLALILTRAFLPLGTFLMRQFFMGIPRELEESAIIDGCGYGRRFTSIIVPLSKPAFVTLLIVTLIMIWNDYLFPLVFIQSRLNRTLTLGLAILAGDFDVQWNIVMAATILSISPLVILFLFAQKYFIEGVALQGTKG